MLLVLVFAVAATRARSAETAKPSDWPGFWGPARSASVQDVLRIGPDTRLREVWRRPLGKGYSEVAVVGGRGYTLFTDGEIDHLIAFDLATGADVWRTAMAATHRGLMGSEDGPLSSPLVAGERIFALDPFGRLFAFDLSTGRQLWMRDLKTELAGKQPAYGYATSPLVVGENLVVQVGGVEHNVVALEQATGATVWSSRPAETTGYASPILTTLAEVSQIVGITPDRIFALAPESGAILWTHPVTGDPIKAPIILPGSRIVVVSWDEAALLAVEREEGTFKLEERWRAPILKANYSPVVVHQGHLYGMNRTYLTCIDLETGMVKWQHKIYEATLILVGDHLAVLGQKSGSFHLVEATPGGFSEVLRAAVFTPGARTVTGPTFVGGRFLLRNGEEIVQLELTDSKITATSQGSRP